MEPILHRRGVREEMVISLTQNMIDLSIAALSPFSLNTLG
jgi:hypothetical protein